ncbi:sigma-70 family RNA polymerase sigma factor [Micromonosporaceae bacterium Da 78-11]
MQVEGTSGGSVRHLAEWRRDAVEDGVAELVTAARRGDRGALGELFTRFAPKMRQVARRRLFGNDDAAQDLVADVWVEVVASIDRWQGRGADPADEFRQMLFGLLRTKCGQHQASRWREVPAGEFSADEPVAVVGGAVYGEEVSSKREELLARLHEGMQQLNPQQREAIRLKMQGLSSQEIAGKVGATAEQVRRRWSLAEARLRLVLSDPLADATGQQLADAAALLTEPHREVMVMRLSGLNARQISARTGREYAYVRKLVQTGREMMRRRMLEPTDSGLIDMQAARQRIESKRAQLREAAARLPEGQREVALLRIDGLRNRDVATKLGRHEKAVVSTWRRAQENLTRLGVVIEMPARGTRTRLAQAA